ncbi:protein kinase family protein [Rhynchospora pubera]|uniref:non-specific serine/threonine protein kinase n=1 Tax=Rhynchospora pubera TaxID=906938 RepID=A0AAV8GU75_9POAL|nr:protein kinase family protein [Rhynchospora pubera]
MATRSSDHRSSLSGGGLEGGGGRRRASHSGGAPDRWDPPSSPSFSVSTSLASTAEQRQGKFGGFFRSMGGCFGVSEKASLAPESLSKNPSSAPFRSPYNGSYNTKGKLSGRNVFGNFSSDFQSCIFTMEEILRATNNFYPGLKIGQGGFGTVYKGTLDDGTLVAVKRAKRSLYNPHVNVEFQSEIKIMAQVEHLNLVRFYGYLEQGDERVVVVEYVPNGTLRRHLDGYQGKYLDMGARLDIAIDVAHAITYLHMYADHPIIHRDIKASNILLTETLRAKVADFGFARLGSGDSGVTHVSTQVKGTAGYLDPEYLRTYQLTEKSDVYSFGVLLVELISSRRPIEPKRELTARITAKWAMKKFTEGKSTEVLDPALPRNEATSVALERVLELAFICLGPERRDRPDMRRCAEVLWNIRKDFRDLLASSDSLGKSSGSK